MLEPAGEIILQMPMRDVFIAAQLAAFQDGVCRAPLGRNGLGARGIFAGS
jgi:hypothetical protein